jgi:hypothetical protein
MLVAIDLLALDDVLIGDLVAGLGIDLEITDSVPGFLIDLVKTDFLGFRCRGKQGDRTRHERKTQKTFQLVRGAMNSNST